MRKCLIARFCACAVLALCGPQLVFSQFTQFGRVHFQTSCAPDVQPRFDNAAALLHSFEFKPAEDAFTKIELSDPSCSIAAWGIALAETERMGANAPQSTLATGWKQLQPWLQKKPGTAREQMYLDAVRAMYEGFDRTPGDARWKNYLGRMDAIRRSYPEDINASLFYALGLVWTAGPGHTGLEQRKQA